MTRQADCLVGAVRTGPGEDRNPTVRHLDADLGHSLVLGMAQRRRFSRGAAGQQPVRALGDLPFDEVAERALVDLAAVERRDQRDIGTLEHGLSSPGGRDG